jgi:hypothetical protein
MVDGSGSTLTATAVRVSVSTSASTSGGPTNTQRFVVSNGGQAVILTDLVLGGSLLNTGQGRDSFNALADIDGGQLTVLSNILFATRLHPTNLASSVFSNHQMMVRGGGVVSAAAITMGNFTNSQSTRLTVTGATSRVDVAGEFRLGHDGRSNVVRVVDGGTLVADQLTLGSGLATNNHLVIDNAAVSITNASGSGLLTLNRGALNLGSGGELRADQLVATNSEGTLTLNAGGRLLLTSTNTSSFGGAGLTIPDGFELGGIGTVAESATINGILSPGLSAGTLAFNNDLTLGSSVQARYELGLPAASDQITVGANLNLNNLVWSNFVFTALGGFASGNYLLVNAAGVSGSLGLETTGTVDGLSAALTLDINNDLVLTVSGTGGGSPVLGVSPAGLSWSGVEVGQSSNLILVVTNSGNAQLDGTATVASAVFSVDSGSPFSLAAGASASVAIRFAPLAAESYQADVILTSNGGGSTNPASGYGFIVAGSTNTSWSLVAGKPTLDFQLVSGALYRVQGSTNLLVESTWEDLTAPLTNRSGGGSITFVETNSPVPVQRAYRIRSP